VLTRALGTLASNSLGQMALAATGTAVALVGLGVAAEQTGRGLLESQRYLAESSASMAMVFALSDMRRTMREMKQGDEQVGTAGFPPESIDALADTLRPIQTLPANIANTLAGRLAAIMDVTLNPLADLINGLNNKLAELAEAVVLSNQKNNTITATEWLMQLAEDERREGDGTNHGAGQWFFGGTDRRSPATRRGPLGFGPSIRTVSRASEP
jgi:hypothetical protein